MKRAEGEPRAVWVYDAVVKGAPMWLHGAMQAEEGLPTWPRDAIAPPLILCGAPSHLEVEQP